MWSLLDADQEIPWVDQPLVFYHKWRLWVQPYNESYHTPLHYGQNTDLTIGSPYEYDVPKCATGVPGCAMVDGTWIHTITGNRIGSYVDECSAWLTFIPSPSVMQVVVVVVVGGVSPSFESRSNLGPCSCMLGGQA